MARRLRFSRARWQCSCRVYQEVTRMNFAVREKSEDKPRARQLRLLCIGCLGLAIILLVRVRSVGSYTPRPGPAGCASRADQGKKPGPPPNARTARAYAASQRYAKEQMDD